MNCDVCTRNMCYRDGHTVIGVQICLRSNGDSNDIETSEIYPEVELDRMYNICWVCMMKSYGIKFSK